MCITWCPPLSSERRQEIRSWFSRRGKDEKPSGDGHHLRSLSANSTTPPAVEQELRNLECPTIVQSPSTRFYFFQERNILLSKELDTLYQLDRNFANFVPPADLKDFSDLGIIMALDPFYNPLVRQFILPDSETEKDAWMRLMKQFSINLWDKITAHANLEHIILLSSDRKSFEFTVQVKDYLKRLAFLDRVENIRMRAAGQGPKVTLWKYQYEEGESQMLAMMRAILAHRL